MSARGEEALSLRREEPATKTARENGYNPCTHGYAAKAWECLRRNSLFLKRLEDEAMLQAQIDQESLYDENGKLVYEPEPPKWYRELKPNRLAGAAIRMMDCPPDKHLGTGIRAENGKTCKDPWTSLSKSEQQMIRASLWPGLAKEIPLSESTSKEWPKLQPDYLIIQAPREILDQAHRKRLLKSIDSLLPKNRAKTKWMKPSGRILGTRRAWEAFLWFEKWHYDQGIERALNFAAMNVFDGGFEASSLTKRDMQLSRHPHFSTTKALVDQINQAIQSVYPDFRPYESGRDSSK